LCTAQIDYKNASQPARNIAKRTMKKLIQLSLVVRTNNALRDCTVDIIKDSWWTVFLVANLWVAWMKAVQAEQMDSDSDSDTDEALVRNIFQRYARKLKAPAAGTAEHDYILSSFLLLRTTQLSREISRSSSAVQVRQPVSHATHFVHILHSKQLTFSVCSPNRWCGRRCGCRSV
jgi:hypothetical protein